MIKPNEVRKGNLVEYDGRVFEIDTIAEEFPTLNTTEFGIGVVDWNNIRPIPLSEEWLLKFGFQKEDEGSVSVQFHYGDNLVTRDYLLSLIWIKDYKSNNNALKGFPFYNNGHFTIKTVHHLQNLVFALGKELTIKN
ncbi:hypothetical protein [uncultured Chryseobacterium sp.]|uniref:hypothetical protein n=1 Tax=uncultured Chryseobacterium sp. TaxID=259322 RepID=UPI0025F0D2C4|nr:hypothetical protein [uncultured Chryseobacterium sp.]